MLIFHAKHQRRGRLEWADGEREAGDERGEERRGVVHRSQEGA